MKIIVLSGSPAGEQSVTLRYVAYLQKRFAQHEWEILHVARDIARLEREPGRFDEVMAAVRAADGVLWAFPLYFCLVCSQYKRFIELVFERGAEDAFAGKFALALSTSIHYFDHTAHGYIRAICDDLDMRFVGAYSARMNDLTQGDERGRLRQFGALSFAAIERGTPTARLHRPLVHEAWPYEPGPVATPVDTQGRRVLILSDAEPRQTNLPAMVRRLQGAFSGDVKVINLHDVRTMAGCQGCCKCGPDNECVFAGKDDFIEFYNTEVCAADILVLAATVKARHISAMWRRFLDRSFFRGHQPSLMGKQFAFLIEGPLTQLPEMREGMEAYVEVEQSNLVGWVSDEAATSAELDVQLQGLAERLVECAAAGYVRPQTFLGVASHKLFRDEVWGPLRIVFQSDHRAYKRLGYYDFPQLDLKTRLLNGVLMPLLCIPRVRKEFRAHMREGMVMPLDKVKDRD